LLDHSYDGIQEFDNPLPRWWVWIFWATFVFSLFYYFDFTGRFAGPGRIKAYEAEIAAAASRWPAPAGPVDAASLEALVGDGARIAAGAQIFTTNCVACHRADGGGLIGPNLTDDHWIHGGTIADVHRTITDGVLEKGMPPWGKILQPDQVTSVAVYVYSLIGSNPPQGKAPEGTKVERGAGGSR
jgi:cytochrome c oxidase cbb3-type subunit 3